MSPPCGSLVCATQPSSITEILQRCLAPEVREDERAYCLYTGLVVLHVARLECEKASGGLIILFVKNQYTLEAHWNLFGMFESNTEALVAHCRRRDTGTQIWSIANIYLPPAATTKILPIPTLFNTLVAPPYNVVIMGGDFNAMHPSWASSSLLEHRRDTNTMKRGTQIYTWGLFRGWSLSNVGIPFTPTLPITPQQKAYDESQTYEGKLNVREYLDGALDFFLLHPSLPPLKHFVYEDYEAWRLRQMPSDHLPVILQSGAQDTRRFHRRYKSFLWNNCTPEDLERCGTTIQALLTTPDLLDKSLSLGAACLIRTGWVSHGNPSIDHIKGVYTETAAC